MRPLGIHLAAMGVLAHREVHRAGRRCRAGSVVLPLLQGNARPIRKRRPHYHDFGFQHRRADNRCGTRLFLHVGFLYLGVGIVATRGEPVGRRLCLSRRRTNAAPAEGSGEGTTPAQRLHQNVPRPPRRRQGVLREHLLGTHAALERTGHHAAPEPDCQHERHRQFHPFLIAENHAARSATHLHHEESRTEVPAFASALCGGACGL